MILFAMLLNGFNYDIAKFEVFYLGIVYGVLGFLIDKYLFQKCLIGDDKQVWSGPELVLKDEFDRSQYYMNGDGPGQGRSTKLVMDRPPGLGGAGGFEGPDIGSDWSEVDFDDNAQSKRFLSVNPDSIAIVMMVMFQAVIGIYMTSMALAAGNWVWRPVEVSILKPHYKMTSNGGEEGDENVGKVKQHIRIPVVSASMEKEYKKIKGDRKAINDGNQEENKGPALETEGKVTYKGGTSGDGKLTGVFLGEGETGYKESKRLAYAYYTNLREEIINRHNLDKYGDSLANSGSGLRLLQPYLEFKRACVKMYRTMTAKTLDISNKEQIKVQEGEDFKGYDENGTKRKVLKLQTWSAMTESPENFDDAKDIPAKGASGTSAAANAQAGGGGGGGVAAAAAAPASNQEPKPPSSASAPP